jgi:hypothetical protein
MCGCDAYAYRHSGGKRSTVSRVEEYAECGTGGTVLRFYGSTDPRWRVTATGQWPLGGTAFTPSPLHTPVSPSPHSACILSTESNLNDCVQLCLEMRDTGCRSTVNCNFVRFEVFTAVIMKNVVFWNIKIQSVPHNRHITSPLQSPAG